MLERRRGLIQTMGGGHAKEAPPAALPAAAPASASSGAPSASRPTPRAGMVPVLVLVRPCREAQARVPRRLELLNEPEGGVGGGGVEGERGWGRWVRQGGFLGARTIGQQEEQ